jgi:yeast amino acid transporter
MMVPRFNKDLGSWRWNILHSTFSVSFGDINMTSKDFDVDAIQAAPPVVQNHETDDEKPVLNTGGHGPTQRRLKGYHITWIGLCSGIGTGLFIGTGSAYASAGPAGLLLAYIVVGAVLWCVMQSISELATLVRSLE